MRYRTAFSIWNFSLVYGVALNGTEVGYTAQKKRGCRGYKRDKRKICALIIQTLTRLTLCQFIRLNL
ncbi:MAG: hypothetical protein L6V93_11565 [Clostridiales bacterium]|nr:MAG: hypothetical protein L6V93_11565 [Clostridiales bacterium]